MSSNGDLSEAVNVGWGGKALNRPPLHSSSDGRLHASSTVRRTLHRGPRRLYYSRSLGLLSTVLLMVVLALQICLFAFFLPFHYNSELSKSLLSFSLADDSLLSTTKPRVIFLGAETIAIKRKVTSRRARTIAPLSTLEPPSQHSRPAHLHPDDSSMCTLHYHQNATTRTLPRPQLYPNCNDFHELFLAGDSIRFLAQGGWRSVFSVSSISFARYAPRGTVLKMLRLDQPLDTNTFGRHRMEAWITSHREMSSIYLYGSCGQSLWLDHTPVTLKIVMRQLKAYERNALQQLSTRNKSSREIPLSSKAVHDRIVGRSLMVRLQYAVQIASGLAILHDHVGAVHADLKPTNLVVVTRSSANSTCTIFEDSPLFDFCEFLNRSVLLNDFDNSEMIRYNASMSSETDECNFRRPLHEKNYYVSPEQVLQRPLTHAIDVYSLGGLMYYLLTDGLRPYDNPEEGSLDALQVMKRIANGRLPILPTKWRHFLEATEDFGRAFEWNASAATTVPAIKSEQDVIAIITGSLMHAMTACWSYNPLDRSSARQIAEFLENVFDHVERSGWLQKRV